MRPTREPLPLESQHGKPTPMILLVIRSSHMAADHLLSAVPCAQPSCCAHFCAHARRLCVSSDNRWEDIVIALGERQKSSGLQLVCSDGEKNKIRVQENIEILWRAAQGALQRHPRGECGLCACMGRCGTAHVRLRRPTSIRPARRLHGLLGLDHRRDVSRLWHAYVQTLCFGSSAYKRHQTAHILFGAATGNATAL